MVSVLSISCSTSSPDVLGCILLLPSCTPSSCCYLFSGRAISRCLPATFCAALLHPSNLLLWVPACALSALPGFYSSPACHHSASPFCLFSVFSCPLLLLYIATHISSSCISPRRFYLTMPCLHIFPACPHLGKMLSSCTPTPTCFYLSSCIPFPCLLPAVACITTAFYPAERRRQDGVGGQFSVSSGRRRGMPAAHLWPLPICLCLFYGRAYCRAGDMPVSYLGVLSLPTTWRRAERHVVLPCLFLSVLQPVLSSSMFLGMKGEKRRSFSLLSLSLHVYAACLSLHWAGFGWSRG